MSGLFKNENRHESNDGGKDFLMGINRRNCMSCENITNISDCNTARLAAISWNFGWLIALYFVEFIILLAVLLCLGYFLKNRNFPVIKTYYACPDNIILTISCLFCFLPIAHIGGSFAELCLVFWPMISVTYAFYAALLSTKTVFVQNLLKCVTFTDHAKRRVAFCVFILLLHITILAFSAFSGFPSIKHPACPTRGMITLCNIQRNISISISMTFNWLFLFLLFVVTLIERVNNHNDLRRSENLTGVTFVAILSYSCLIICSYFNRQLENATLVTFLLYVLYLINPVVALARLYLQIVYLNFTSLRSQESSETCAENICPRLQSTAGEVLFNYSVSTNFDPGQIPFVRPLSVTSSLSYPSSLACADHEFVRVVSDFSTNAMKEYHTYPTESRQYHAHPAETFQYHTYPRESSQYHTYPTESYQYHAYPGESCLSSSETISRGIPSLKNSNVSLTIETATEEQPGDDFPDIEVTYEELQQMLSLIKSLESSDV